MRIDVPVRLIDGSLASIKTHGRSGVACCDRIDR